MRRASLLAAPLLLVCLISCRPERPMTRNEIYEAQQAVPTLYRTESGDEFIAPGNKFGATVKPGSKEIGWATWKCGNPDCPAKNEGKDGRPFLFIWPNFLAYVKEDGTLAFRLPQGEADMEKFKVFAEPGCPACAKTRNKDAETPQQRQQYQNWATRYVLPEAEARIKELDEEMKKFNAREEERKRRAGQS
jgi:hypothetical protein